MANFEDLGVSRFQRTGTVAGRAQALEDKMRSMGLDPSQVHPARWTGLVSNPELYARVLDNPLILGLTPTDRFYASVQPTVRAEDNLMSPEQIAAFRAGPVVSPLDMAPEPEPAPVIPGAAPAAGVAPPVREVAPAFTPRTLDDIMAGAEKYASTRPENASLEELRKIELRKPEFEEGFGKVDPSYALLRAGLGMLSGGVGKAPLAAIAGGAEQGLAQFAEEKKIAAAQQKEMRDAERQYAGDLLSRAKTIAELEMKDADAQDRMKQFYAQTAKAVQDGDYQRAALAYQRMQAEASIAASTPKLAEELVQLQRSIRETEDPKKKAALTEEFELKKSLYGRGIADRTSSSLQQLALREANDTIDKLRADFTGKGDALFKQFGGDEEKVRQYLYEQNLRRLTGGVTTGAKEPAGLPGRP